MGQSSHLTNLQVLQNWEEWWMHQLVVVPFRKTSAGPRNGTTWTSWRHQRETQSPACREEQFHIPIHAGVQTLGKQLGKEGPVGPMELQAGREVVVHSRGKPGHWLPQLQWAECDQPHPTCWSREVILLLCSAVVTPLECFTLLCASQQETGIEVLEQVQQKAPEMFKELEHFLNRERLRELGLFSPERSRLRWRNEKPHTQIEGQEIPFKLFYCDCHEIGTGCPERLWSLHL